MRNYTKKQQNIYYIRIEYQGVNFKKLHLLD